MTHPLKICLITTSQPSGNPRLLKEADTLVESGYDVHVIGANRVDWATAADQRLLATRRWAYTCIDWRRSTRPLLFWKTRLRHYAARQLQRVPGFGHLSLGAAIDRSTPELTRVAIKTPADLYVAHNPGALPAAARAAQANNGLLGFDAEDFHSGEFLPNDYSPLRLAAERVESTFIPRCDYVTAASPDIADAYAPLTRHGRPTCILNVFSLASRPEGGRQPTSAAGPLKLYWFSQTIGPGRGLEDIVQAMSRFPAGAIELHLRGRWHGQYADEIQAVAEHAGVRRNHISWHPPAGPEEMVRLAAAYDVGLAVEPGRDRNNNLALSNKIFTYLLAGTAVLGTRTQAQAPVLDGLPGAALSYRSGNIDEAAEQLRPWVESRALVENARAQAWQYGESRYNWEHEKTKYLEVIANVVASRTRTGGMPGHARLPMRQAS